MNNQNSSGMINGFPPARKSDKKVGPIVGALIIVLILIIAALYFFGKKLNTQSVTTDQPATQQTQSANTSASTDSQSTQSMDADLDAQLKDVDYSF